MSLDDWILALHVLSAFALVGALVLFWILIVVMRDTDTASETIAFARVATVGNRVVIVGIVGTLVFGVWLAISQDAYQLWDGWIIAAIVLSAISLATGQRTGVAYMQGMTKAQELQSAGQSEPNSDLLALNRTSNGVLLHGLTTLVLVLILIDMIWKPGA